ncbi:insulinase family protein [Candidatus Parabeggiatoa sp. HSG14]|uniref:insulinase family protein n=1 Tax=Candidatus Parabeggiatoa sp. HSG14 TaxID=3055593 RepID=UPI0025A8B35C|nr:insulinase family protein [Thiotrichales bacterium HSG14]
MSHPAFSFVRQARISSLNIEVEEYRHTVTGARHLHLSADDNNNAFLVAFLTVPQDSTGVAHILEHTTLCGSKRYPIRDPFFLMLRRSLNTFMNAFTSSDWTAYPFASQNVKDFDNLLQVYLDATFFPNLNALDFYQEGHRVEFETPNDPNTPLVYKGVVFNEMKGALSSPVQRLLYAIHHYLFPTITYHYNSGGDPKVIPQLTHAQLKAFHANHYHPSNAIFMTYGDRPASVHQRLFEECALQHFKEIPLEKKEGNFQIPDEQRYDKPQQVVTYYPLDKQEETQNKTHIVLSWLLGYNTDIREVMNTYLLTGVLLDNSASPLRHVLETTSLGTAPSPLCGFDDSTREGCFMCGLDGSNPEQADAVEDLILQVLKDIADNGVPLELVESVLHQIELSQREITGDGFPYGLRFLVNTVSPMLHGGDPIAFLDIDPVLTALRKDAKDPHFIPNLVRQLLLDNPHRVRIVMTPDVNLAAQQVAEEKAQLEILKAAMTDEDKSKVVEQTVILEARQQTKDDPDALPKVGLEDVAQDLKIPQGTSQPVNEIPATWFARGTNGIVYQKIVIDLPDFEAELLDILPLFCDFLTEVGCGDKDYREIAAQQAAVTGGISARISLRSTLSDVQTVRAMFNLSGKALVRNQAALTELLRETLEQARFDELSRLRELIAQIRAENDNSIAARGVQLVMSACSSGMSPSGNLSHCWHGLAGIQMIRMLDSSLENEENLKAFAAKLERIRHKLLEAPRQLLVVSEAEQHAHISETFTKIPWHTANDASTLPFKPSPINKVVKEAWSINTQVNFCAKAYPTVPEEHPDTPILVVLGQFLQNGFLHNALREQGGAYGSGAGYDSDTGAFRFYSLRDPRLVETLADFDQSLVWLQNTKHEPRALEEAILGVISRIDRPGSPAGEAIIAFFNGLHGRTPEHRREFRRQILQVKIEDLQRVASTYLKPEKANTAVLSNAKTLADLPELALERKVL